jgi:diguanylate cyclase (GGDEF)-like protein
MDKEFYKALQRIAGELERCNDTRQVCLTVLDEMLGFSQAEAGCALEASPEGVRVVERQGYSSFELDVAAVSQLPLVQRLVQTNEPYLLADRQADPDDWYASPQDFQSWLGGIAWIDVQRYVLFIFESKEIAAFADQHVYLLGAICAQAGLAFNNLHLRAEMELRLGRERKLNELMHTIASELDLPLVLQHVVRMAADILQADCGALGLLSPDETTIEYAHLYGLPEVPPEYIGLQGGLAGDILQSGRAVRLDRYTEYPHATSAWVAAGVKACAGALVTAGEARLGVLLLFYKESERTFEESDLVMLEMAGRQAGIAIQNVRMFDKERQRADEYEALRNTLAELSAVLDLPRLLNSILERAVILLMASGGELGLYDHETDTIQVVASYRMGKDYSGSSLAVGEGAIGRAVFSQEPVMVADYRTWEGRSPRYTDSPCHAVMAAPLVLREVMVGAISVMDIRPERRFSQEDMNLLALFAQQAAVTVDNAQHYDQAQQLATVDELTGLFNRRYFFEMARREFERSLRYGLPLSAVMLDIDWFKQVNDSFGHPVGDQVLQAVARTCKGKLREVDLLARYGGEEFVILLPNTALHGARQVADRLHRSITEMVVQSNDHLIRVTISLGVAELGTSCTTLDALLECADQALMKAKQSGRNRVSIYWPS